MAQAAGLISKTLGFSRRSRASFPSEVWRCGGGILGPNEYTLQINTNFTGTTRSMCGPQRLHRVAAVHLCALTTNSNGQAAVFMQYWLIGWGSSPARGIR